MTKKSAVLFGSTGGIGHNLLRGLLIRNYEVILPVRSIPLAESILRSSVSEKQNSVKFISVDLGDNNSIKDFILNFQGSPPGLLIFASGIRDKNHSGKINRDFEINYVAPITIALGFLEKFPSLSVINITSSAALRLIIRSPQQLFERNNLRFGGNYAKSKLALILATKCLAKLYPDSRIISVDPGSNRTKMTLGNEAPLILRIVAMMFFLDPCIGANRVMNAIFSMDVTSGTHITAKGKIHDMRRYKRMASYVDSQIKGGFPFMPV